MNRNLLLSLICFLNVAAAAAQPTLTAASNMPNIGYQSKVYDNNQFTPGPAGANQTWDFSTQTFSSPDWATFQACNSTNRCNTYTGANTAYKYGNTYCYYQASGNTITMEGFFTGLNDVFYTNPEDYLHFPFTYGNTFVDSFAGHYAGGGGSYYRRGVDSVSADGWGTLSTPDGTFKNVLRIKTISTYQDTGFNMSGPDKIRYKGYTYNWLDVKHRDFLFTTASITTTHVFGSGSSTVSYGRYTSDQTVDVAPLAETGARCRVLQNPASGCIKLSVGVDHAGEVSLVLTDITGSVKLNVPSIQLKAGDNQLSMPVPGLAAGIYTLRVMAGDAAAALKVVLE